MELTGATIVRVPTLLDPQSIATLLADIDTAFADQATHAIVLFGDDEVFCRGLDLGRAAQDEDATAALESFAECLRRIRNGSKPAIALVRGVAVGGGVGLAAACDAVLATTGATFAQTELLFGLIPAIVLPYLAQRVVEQKLRWIALRAQPLTAQEALEIGLADQVCASADALKVLRHWVRQMQRVQPPAVAMWKRLTNKTATLSTDEAIQATLERLRDPAVRVGLKEFMETGCLPSTPKDS